MEAFLEDFLGMRYEMIDQTEFIRRIDGEIYDKDEYRKALEWVKTNCRIGRDVNPKGVTDKKKAKEWEFVVKMVLIGRDLMVGNPQLAAMGYGEEAMGHNAIASGFQGQRQWTDTYPNGDFLDIFKGSRPWAPSKKTFNMHVEANADTQFVGVYGYGFAPWEDNVWSDLSPQEQVLAHWGGISTVVIELCNQVLSVVTNSSIFSLAAPLSDRKMITVLSNSPIRPRCPIRRPMLWSMFSTIAPYNSILRAD